MSDDFHIEKAGWPEEEGAIRAVRETVFIREQQVPEEIEWDGIDPNSLHVIAYDHQNKPIGTGRLQPSGKIGRIAVLRDYRGKGIGGKILEALIEEARQRNHIECHLHAQTQALDFYAHYGFVEEGEEFEEAEIPHKLMRLTLREANEDDEPKRTFVALSTMAENRDAVIELAKIARRSIAIFTHDLEPELYAASEFLESVRQMVIGTRFAQVRILLKDTTRAVKDGHRLTDLVKHLSSYMEIRKPHPDYMDLAETFMVVDEVGLLYRTLATRPEGIADPHDPSQAREKLRLFDTIWLKSEQDPEMRRLGI
ncbi:MAG: GNAT family N-acetyltransferase [Gammaproteobacteria bacterium]|nr:GNAT family N-acetyltransferase [Gammaproteobacteria bacterium]